MSIKNNEITVVIQGPVIENETQHSISSIKQFLPGAKIILSTWKDSKFDGLDVDELILNSDPESYPCGILPNGQKKLYNLNRQLVSTQNGLKKVKTKYVLKLRSDLYFTKDFSSVLLKYFDKFNSRDDKFAFFKHRVIVSSLISKIYADFDDNSFPLPFHVSDWLFFGLTEDIQEYFLNTPLLDEKDSSNYPCDVNKIPVKLYNWKIPPEQYFCYEWTKRHIDCHFDNWSDWNFENVVLSEKIVANNFIVLDTIQHGLYLNKYIDFINDNDGEVYSFQGYISHLKFVQWYQKYCDNSFKIPLSLKFSKNKKHNKLIHKLRYYKSKKRIFKIAIIKLKIFLLEQKIIIRLKKRQKVQKNRKYDIVIPCSHCQPTYHLSKKGLRYIALPLDYMCGFSILDACNLLRDDFKHFLKNISVNNEKGTDRSPFLVVFDNEYNVTSLHHFRKDKDFLDEKESTYQKFQKRYKKLRKMLEKGFLACILVNDSEEEKIKYLIDTLKEKFPYSSFDVINVINNKDTNTINKNVIYYNNSKITTYVFNNKYVGCLKELEWVGNINCWNKVTEDIKLSFNFKWRCFFTALSQKDWKHRIKIWNIQKIIDFIRSKKTYNVISRVAGLGGAATHSIKNFNCLYNFQKNRIDCIVDFDSHLNNLLDYDETVKQIGDKPEDIVSMLRDNYKAQREDFFSFDKVNAIVVDSFSELADKKFTNKKSGWSFYSCITDVKKDDTFDENYDTEGSLDENLIENYYLTFMQKVIQKYGKIPVFYIHYPSKFEDREFYIQRAKSIINSIDKVSKRYKNLHPIKLQDSEIFQNKDGLTYHFSDKTVQNIVLQMQKNIKIRIKDDFFKD